MQCVSCQINTALPNTIFCASCRAKIVNEIDKIDKMYLHAKDQEYVLFGISLISQSLWLKQMRNAYGNRIVALWHFRRFDQLCDYIDVTINPDFGKDLNAIALQTLIVFFVKYIKTLL